MLKGINPLLNADVLYALRAMGHGDDVIIADTNFPSDSVARQTTLGRLLRIDASAAEVARAVLSVYPLDTFVDDAAAEWKSSVIRTKFPRCNRGASGDRRRRGKILPMVRSSASPSMSAPTGLLRHRRRNARLWRSPSERREFRLMPPDAVTPRSPEGRILRKHCPAPEYQSPRRDVPYTVEFC